MIYGLPLPIKTSDKPLVPPRVLGNFVTLAAFVGMANYLVHTIKESLSITDPQLDAKYAQLTPGVPVVFAAFDWYKLDEKNWSFGREYCSRLKVISNPSKDPEIQAYAYEASKLLFGYHDQATGNLAFKFLMRHNVLFDACEKNASKLPYRSYKHLCDSSRLLLEAINETVFSNPDQKPDMFAKRIERNLVDESKNTDSKENLISHFFISFHLTDISADEYYSFLKKHNLDRSGSLRKLFSDAAQSNPYYKEVLNKFSSEYTPIIALEWSEVIVSEPIKRQRKDIKVQDEKLMEQLRILGELNDGNLPSPDGIPPLLQRRELDPIP